MGAGGGTVVPSGVDWVNCVPAVVAAATAVVTAAITWSIISIAPATFRTTPLLLLGGPLGVHPIFGWDGNDCGIEEPAAMVG